MKRAKATPKKAAKVSPKTAARRKAARKPVHGATQGPRQRAGARAVKARETELLALELRKAGASYRRIAAELKISKTTAHEMVLRVIDETVKKQGELAGQVLSMELERLDDLQLAVWASATKGDLRAIDRVLKISERRAVLLGLEKRALELSGPGGADLDFGGGGATEKVLSLLEKYEKIGKATAPKKEAA